MNSSNSSNVKTDGSMSSLVGDRTDSPVCGCPLPTTVPAEVATERAGCTVKEESHGDSRRDR